MQGTCSGIKWNPINKASVLQAIIIQQANIAYPTPTATKKAPITNSPPTNLSNYGSIAQCFVVMMFHLIRESFWKFCLRMIWHALYSFSDVTLGGVGVWVF